MCSLGKLLVFITSSVVVEQTHQDYQEIFVATIHLTFNYENY